MRTQKSCQQALNSCLSACTCPAASGRSRRRYVCCNASAGYCIIRWCVHVGSTCLPGLLQAAQPACHGVQACNLGVLRFAVTPLCVCSSCQVTCRLGTGEGLRLERRGCECVLDQVTVLTCRRECGLTGLLFLHAQWFALQAAAALGMLAGDAGRWLLVERPVWLCGQACIVSIMQPCGGQPAATQPIQH
jgi:hypothetical protein